MASISGVLQDNDGNDLYPYTFDQEVLDANNVPISQRLGSASEASAVAGTSAFAKINTLSSDLTNNNLDTFVDLSNTSWGSKYTTPSDGFAYVYNESGKTGAIGISGGNGSNTAVAQMGSKEGLYSCYIKKGMKIFATNANATTIGFYPIIT